MTVLSRDVLRSSIAAFRSSAPSQLHALQEALEAAGAIGPGRRSLDEVLEIALLTAARVHEQRLEGITVQMRDALVRVLDDVDATRASGPGAVRRPEAARRADLGHVARAIDGIETFEGFVRRGLDDPASDLRRALDDAVQIDPRAIMTRALGRGRETAERADALHAAWLSGRTVEEAGPGLPIGSDPALAGIMADLDRAVAEYRRAPGATAEAATATADRLARVTADAGERLRSAATAFTGGRIGSGMGSAASRAAEQAVAARLAAHPATVAAGSAADVLDALHVEHVDFRFSGTLREPLPRLGLEESLLVGAGIRALRTRPPSLAARLATMFAGWQRGHAIGPGLGSELSQAIGLVPQSVNLIAQNSGIEAFLRHLHAVGEAPHVTVTPRIRELAVPLANGQFDSISLQTSIAYLVQRANGAPITFRIDIQPNGSWTVTHTIPTGMPGANVALAGAP